MKRLLVLLLISLFACEKDKVPSTETNTNCEDIQNVKKYFAFNVGSWWVYEEENSGDRDSVYVTDFANDPSNYNFDVRMYSTYQDYSYHFWPVYYSTNGCPENGEICQRCLSVKRSKYKPGDFVAETKCFFFIPLLGEFDYEPNIFNDFNKVQIISVFDEYQIGILLFNKTFCVHENNAIIDDGQPTNHYYSEGVGLIKKELLDSNKIWNLVDYYIQP